MEIDDEVSLTIIVKIVPKGEYWKSGLLQTTKHLQLPIRLLDYNKLNLFLLDLAKEIEENGVQTTS